MLLKKNKHVGQATPLGKEVRGKHLGEQSSMEGIAAAGQSLVTKPSKFPRWWKPGAAWKPARLADFHLNGAARCKSSQS